MLKKAALFVLVALATGAWAAEFPLELKTLSQKEAMAGPGGIGAFAQLKSEKPAAITKEPDAVSDRPLYGALTTPGGKGQSLVFRLDESQGKGKGYDQLIVDVNKNGDLTDDPVCKALKEEEKESSPMPYEHALFGPIEMAAAKVGPWVPNLYAEMFVMNRRAPANSRIAAGQLQLKDASYLQATIEINGAKETIGIFDANCNFQLGDKSQMQLLKTPQGENRDLQWGDAVLRDRSGSGKPATALAGTLVEPYSELVYVGPNPYTMTLAKDLTTVALEPYSGPVGELQVKNGESMALLIMARESAPGQWEALSPDVASGKAKVPVGTCALYSCVVAGKDSGNALVAATGMNADSKKTLKITEGKSATLVCGAPLEFKVQAQKESGGGGGFLGALVSGGTSNLLISAQILGAGGEAYRTFARSDGQAVGGPKFKVLGQNGKELGSGQLQFG